ncbi:MAG: DEAD/DEAH box helicase [Clostridiales bacterium]|nr:DEAD/DEAH box helicase [Clostridiales bacterium]
MNISDSDIRKICSDSVYRSGMDYFKEGRVHIRVRSENSIVAAVDAAQIYNVHIGFDDNGGICETFCTCPYYQTMSSNCKHIVAVLKARQNELISDCPVTDTNDRVAGALCGEYERQSLKKQPVHIGFIFNITTNHRRECSYSAAIKLGHSDSPIAGIEGFLQAYITGSSYKLPGHKNFDPQSCTFSGYEEHILTILAEAYQNKAAASAYTPRLTSVDFGSYTAGRLLPLMQGADCRFTLNGMPQPNMRIRCENPDILVDLTATDDNINISIPQSGLAVIPDGSWFFYDGDLYSTSSDWRKWFMPLYSALATESRTQIDFKGRNSARFAANVLPALKGQKGVVAQGIYNIIVDEKPAFSVYFDRFADGISAAVIARYGSISVRLPDGDAGEEKIIVRDRAGEQYIMSFFDGFDVSGKTLYLGGNDEIYSFITEKLDRLSEAAEIHLSDSFRKMVSAETPHMQGHVSYSSKINLLEVGFESNLSPVEIAGILHAMRRKKSYYRMKDGSFLTLDDKMSAFDILNSLDFSFAELRGGRKQVSKYHALFLAGAAENGSIKADKSFDSLIEEIRSIRADIPDYLDKILRGYQKTGVHWMKQLSELGYGGILADDMGLGKTLEVIAFIMSEKPHPPALVVTPSALTYNWLSEITRFAPSAKAKIIDGTKEDRVRGLSDISGYDFIITSYPLLRRDIQEYSGIEFSYCFIDEAQNIKNPKTLSAKAVKRIHAASCFALSGTPIENSLSELWSIFDFIMPEYLGTYRQFSDKFEKPVSDGDDSAADALRQRIKPFMLRRMKYDVLSELPGKIENTFFAELEPSQKKIYSAYLAAARREASEIIAYGGDNIRILSLLMRLRQICCHPALIDENYDKGSGKLKLLEELVSSALESGHRILIFSQFTSMLDIIRRRLTDMGVETFYLDGKTSSFARTEMADRFNKGERSVFLVSLKAGGSGLNLIGADMVIHYDPWWNPAAVDQASDRAYRIGQTKAVHVIRLAGKGTIEEQMLKLQDKKRRLADDMIRTNSSTLSSLSKEEIMELFSQP